MPRLFIGNFDFEHRLAQRTASLPEKLLAINASLAPAWLAIAEDGDAIWFPRTQGHQKLPSLPNALPRVNFISDPTHLPAGYELMFWGENEWAEAVSGAWGIAWRGCNPKIVRRVNSRLWKFELERKLNVAPAGLASTAGLDSLADTLRHLPDDNWVLKTEFGGAGREIRFGRGPLTASEQSWATSRYRKGLAILVEPRLTRIEETGLQFQIGQDGEVHFLGVTPLLTRPNGSFIGSRYENDDTLISIWHDAIIVAEQAARMTAALGYFGPLGIDAMRYLDQDGNIRIRPLQDLNARFTMGRLALGLRRFPAYAAATNYTFSPLQFGPTDHIADIQVPSVE